MCTKRFRDPKRWPSGGAPRSRRKIDGFHRRWAGSRLVLASGWNAYRNIVRVAGAIVDAHGVTLAESQSVFELAHDGRIAKVWSFWEAALEQFRLIAADLGAGNGV